MKLIVLFINQILISLLFLILFQVFFRYNTNICFEKAIVKYKTIELASSVYKFTNDTLNSFKLKNLDQDTFKMAEELTNVAINYWFDWRDNSHTEDEWKGYEVNTCNTTIPGIENLNFNNIYWQTMESNKKNEYHFYNAYYDNRGTDKTIRIIASQRALAKIKLWCLLYFEGKRQSVISGTEKYIDKYFIKGQSYQTVLFSCQIPKTIEHLVPKAISLIGINRCPKKVSNLLRVIYERPESGRKEFAVCHKALRFADIDLSLRLIEWLELLSIFGVSKVYLYALAVHPNMEKVLNYYQKLGFVEWRYTALPGNQINNRYLYRYYHDTLRSRYWNQERLELNDCFYRNLHKYEFIGNFDLDEMIVPKKAENWSQMFRTIKAKTRNANKIQSFIFLGAKVYSDIESNANQFAYSLKHLHRSRITIEYRKCIHVSRRAKYLGTHTSYGSLFKRQKCITEVVAPNKGYFLHYRLGIKYNQTKRHKNDLFFDPSLKRYEKTLTERIKFALKQMFY